MRELKVKIFSLESLSFSSKTRRNVAAAAVTVIRQWNALLCTRLGACWAPSGARRCRRPTSKSHLGLIALLFPSKWA